MAEKLVDVAEIKATWEKGSTTETPMRHKHGLSTWILFFFFFFFFFLKIPKIWVGESEGDGFIKKKKKPP